eukprot:GHVP01070031.1.p1 GENE.GHVP01070031.1~~GHVP01070031.1.p1  ORF type:complete len:157 (+),score=14.77 GHVP01070031.1:46-516(+)
MARTAIPEKTTATKTTRITHLTRKDQVTNFVGLCNIKRIAAWRILLSHPNEYIDTTKLKVHNLANDVTSNQQRLLSLGANFIPTPSMLKRNSFYQAVNHCSSRITIEPKRQKLLPWIKNILIPKPKATTQWINSMNELLVDIALLKQKQATNNLSE